MIKFDNWKNYILESQSNEPIHHAPEIFTKKTAIHIIQWLFNRFFLNNFFSRSKRCFKIGLCLVAMKNWSAQPSTVGGTAFAIHSIVIMVGIGATEEVSECFQKEIWYWIHYHRTDRAEFDWKTRECTHKSIKTLNLWRKYDHFMSINALSIHDRCKPSRFNRKTVMQVCVSAGNKKKTTTTTTMMEWIYKKNRHTIVWVTCLQQQHSLVHVTFYETKDEGNKRSASIEWKHKTILMC